MTHIVASWHISGRHGRYCGVMAHIVTSWHISWWHDTYCGVMTHIGASWQILWRLGSYRDVMTYIVVAWHISWRHDINLGVMVHILTSWYIVASWLKSWRHDTYFKTLCFPLKQSFHATHWFHCKEFSIHIFYGKCCRHFGLLQTGFCSLLLLQWVLSKVVSWQKVFSKYILYGKWRQHNGFTAMNIVHIGNVLCRCFPCNIITLLLYGNVFASTHWFHGNSIFSTSVSWQSYFRHTSKVTEHISVETDTRSLKGQCTRWTEVGICTATRERTPLAIL